jgi:beta-galactosidase
MKYLLLLLTCLTLQVNAEDKTLLFCYFTDNGQDGLHLAYSHDGLKWEALNQGKSYLTPTVGPDKLMRDPCITKGPDGIFHMVWTCSWKDKQIGVAHSKDLIHWSEQMAIPVMAHEPTAKNCWAPEIIYDSKAKNYLIFWATTIPDRHSPIEYSKQEKGLNHRMYCTTTTDFKSYTPTRMFFNPAFSVIDATIFPRNKNYFLLLKNENPNPAEKNIRLTSSKSASGPYPTAVSQPITGNYWAEGPTAIEINDYVYVYFDRYTEHRYGAVRSKNLTDWEDISDQIKFPDGTRHGTAFKVSAKLFKELINPK